MTGDDQADIFAVIDQAYSMLEFEPGSQPDWEIGEHIYSPHAVLALQVFPEDTEVSVMSWTQYRAAQMRDNLEQHGYSETPGARALTIVGDVASVQQGFTMNFRHRAPAEAIDIFSLLRHRNAWRIVSVVSDSRQSC